LVSRNSRITFVVPAENIPELIQTVQEHFNVSSILVESEIPYPNKRIFISYRRTDSEDICGRIYDRLMQAFGRENVFRDVTSIPPGFDFKPILEEEVAQCNVMLAIMGQTWASGKNRKRLHNDEDYVRFEIETALKRNIPVIPIWVGRRISMPDLNDLPDTLHELVRRQARQARPDPDFHTDMDKLISDIKAIFDFSQPENL
jgi:hypothetical protein